MRQKIQVITGLILIVFGPVAIFTGVFEAQAIEAIIQTGLFYGFDTESFVRGIKFTSSIISITDVIIFLITFIK